MKHLILSLVLLGACAGCMVLDSPHTETRSDFTPDPAAVGPGAMEQECFTLDRNRYRVDDGWRLGIGLFPGFYHEGTDLGGSDDVPVYCLATVGFNLFFLYPTLSSVLEEPLGGFSRRCKSAHNGIIGFHYWRLEPEETFLKTRESEKVVRCEHLVKCPYFAALTAEIKKHGHADRLLSGGRTRRFEKSAFDPVALKYTDSP